MFGKSAFTSVCGDQDLPTAQCKIPEHGRDSQAGGNGFTCGIVVREMLEKAWISSSKSQAPNQQETFLLLQRVRTACEQSEGRA